MMYKSAIKYGDINEQCNKIKNPKEKYKTGTHDSDTVESFISSSVEYIESK